jgi:hypothetical protein
VQRPRELPVGQLEDRLRQVSDGDGAAELVGEERHVDHAVDRVEDGALVP